MNKNITLNTLSVVELKALVYDSSVIIEQEKRAIEMINQEISLRNQMVAPVAEKDVEAKKLTSDEVEQAKKVGLTPVEK